MVIFNSNTVKLPEGNPDDLCNVSSFSPTSNHIKSRFPRHLPRVEPCLSRTRLSLSLMVKFVKSPLYVRTSKRVVGPLRFVDSKNSIEDIDVCSARWIQMIVDIPIYR